MPCRLQDELSHAHLDAVRLKRGWGEAEAAAAAAAAAAASALEAEAAARAEAEADLAALRVSHEELSGKLSAHHRPSRVCFAAPCDAGGAVG